MIASTNVAMTSGGENVCRGRLPRVPTDKVINRASKIGCTRDSKKLNDGIYC